MFVFVVELGESGHWLDREIAELSQKIVILSLVCVCIPFRRGEPVHVWSLKSNSTAFAWSLIATGDIIWDLVAVYCTEVHSDQSNWFQPLRLCGPFRAALCNFRRPQRPSYCVLLQGRACIQRTYRTIMYLGGSAVWNYRQVGLKDFWAVQRSTVIALGILLLLRSAHVIPNNDHFIHSF